MSQSFDGRAVVWPHTNDVGPADPHTQVDVALWLRGRNDAQIAAEVAMTIGAERPASRTYRERAELETETDTDPNDFATVTECLHRHNVRIVSVAWRCIYATGTVATFAHLFGTEIHLFDNGATQPFLRRDRPMRLVPEIAEIVRAVVGLDAWPMARATMQPPAPPLPSRTAAAMTPSVDRAFRADDVVRRYNFPRDATGRGQTIGILRFGGVFDRDDFAACMAAHGVDVPNVVSVDVEAMPQDAADVLAFGQELAIDVHVAGALAPGATLALYGTSHGERGFLRGLAAAIFDDVRRPQTLSISFGWREARWTPGALRVMEDLFVVAALVGTSVFCASGDAGREEDTRGVPHVLAPASSRFVHACGATQIGDDDREAPWPRSGGGFSACEPRPPWQNALPEERRALPDLSAQTLPGYLVITHGKHGAASGTSAVAPMMAALTARLNERLSKACGFFAPICYSDATSFGSITLVEDSEHTPSRLGWSPATGLGTPDGVALLAMLIGAGRID